MGTFDVVVLQPTIHWFLRPLWDNGPVLTDAEREEHLQVLLNSLALSLQRAKRCAANGLLLVQGISTPTFSPLGTTEFRLELNFQRIVATLNTAIFDFIRDDPDAMYIDEERILSVVGKQRVLDDTVSIYSHHEPLGTLLMNVTSPGSVSDHIGRDELAALLDLARSERRLLITEDKDFGQLVFSWRSV